MYPTARLASSQNKHLARKKTASSEKKQVNKKAISLAEARDGGLSKGAHRALVALTFLAGSRDSVEVSDEALSALMSSEQGMVSPASVRGLLSSLGAAGYLTQDRKRKGCDERHITLCNPFSAREREENSGEEKPGKSRRICTEPAQIPPPDLRKKKEKIETPKRHKRESLNQESLGSLSSLGPNSLALERLEPLDPNLEALAAQYGGEHYHPDVVEAAYHLGDLPGLPHYANAHRFLAQGDQDVWAEAVECTITYVRGGGVDSPRRYLEVCLQDVLEAQRQRDRLLGRGTDEVGEVPERSSCLPESAKDIMDDPFADDCVADDVAEFVPGPEPVVDPDPEPVAGAAIHPAVAEAMQTLGLAVAVEDVQAVFDGACHGRESLFALVVSAMTGIAVQSPIAFMCRVASEHKDKDDAYLNDRTSGITVAERTEMLKAFERWLDEQKQALNPPLTPCGGFRSDTPTDLKPLLNGIMGQATKTANPSVSPYLASAVLPDSPQGWAALEEAMGQMRDAYVAADPRLRAEADAAGFALANAQVVRTESPKEWEQWRRAGVYHAFGSLRQAEVRTEAVRREQKRQEAPEGTEYAQEASEAEPDD